MFAILVAPMLAMMVQMAISRSREYQADRLGALICGNPLWLASALARIDAAARRIPNIQAERAPAAAHVFIVNPLTAGGMDNLFATHPNVANRIAALEQLARELGMSTAATRSAYGDGQTSGLPSSERGPAGPWSRRSERGPWG